MVGAELCVPIDSEVDIVAARQAGRQLAEQTGFSTSEQTLIATAISEVARNIIQYAGSGRVVLSRIEGEAGRGVCIVAEDEGPGIADVDLAMQDGYSTSGGLGMGLPGSKRLMDEFELKSEVGKGTTVLMKRWVRG